MLSFLRAGGWCFFRGFKPFYSFSQTLTRGLRPRCQVELRLALLLPHSPFFFARSPTRIIAHSHYRSIVLSTTYSPLTTHYFLTHYSSLTALFYPSKSPLPAGETFETLVAKFISYHLPIACSPTRTIAIPIAIGTPAHLSLLLNSLLTSHRSLYPSKSPPKAQTSATEVPPHEAVC